MWGDYVNNLWKSMIHSFWRKRPSKKLTATLLFFAVLAIVFLFRRPIAIKAIEHFTKPHDVYVTCLNFSFDWRLNLNITQACLTSPLGNVEVSNAIWQLWSNVLNIEHVKIKHFEQLTADNKVDKKPSSEQQIKYLNLPDSLPILSIVSLEIESFELLQPLYLSASTTSNNGLSITGDVNVSVKIEQNTLVGNVDWRLSDLTKWLPQAQTLFQDNPELLKDIVLDESKIKTSLIFDGETFNVDNSLDLSSRIYVSNCPIDVFIKGNLLVNVDINSLNTSLDLRQLSSNVLVEDCLPLQDYFAAGDLPHLSLIIPQKLAIDKTQINLPELQIVDEQNIHRSITLSALNYKKTGELEVNYNISVKQPIQTKIVEAGMLDFQARGKASADFSTLNTQSTQQPINLKIVDDNNQLVISALKFDSLLIGNLNSEFKFHHSEPKQISIKGTIISSAIQMGAYNLAKTNSIFSVSGLSFNDLQLRLDNQFFTLTHSKVSIKNITNHIDLNILGLDALNFYGNSTITKSSVQNINMLPINVAHTGQASFANMTLSSQHKASFEHGFSVEIEQLKTKVKVQINQQSVISLRSIISQLESALMVKEGNLSANIELTLPQDSEQFIAKGKANFQGVSAKYQDYALKNITYQTPLTFDSAGLQLVESTLYIDSIDAGVMIEQLEANVIAQNSILRLTQVQGEIFNGTFLLGDLWLDGREQAFNINIQNIDLAQVIALQKQPGISISGDINGDMPFIIGKQGIRIDNGRVSSLTGGKLSIIDNPSFDSIKEQQPELALLENIDFTQLKSNVKFTPDGWIFFDFAIKGNNPDKKQSVNFNYTHQENIFTLLESIRLVKSVENKIEQKITQGDKK
jgi:hypothetical protein